MDVKKLGQRCQVQINKDYFYGAKVFVLIFFLYSHKLKSFPHVVSTKNQYEAKVFHLQHDLWILVAMI